MGRTPPGLGAGWTLLLVLPPPFCPGVSSQAGPTGPCPAACQGKDPGGPPNEEKPSPLTAGGHTHLEQCAGATWWPLWYRLKVSSPVVAQGVPVGGSLRPQAWTTVPLTASPSPQPFSKGPTSKSGPTPLLGETKAPNGTGSCSYHTNQHHRQDWSPEPLASGPGSNPAGRGQAPLPRSFSLFKCMGCSPSP